MWPHSKAQVVILVTITLSLLAKKHDHQIIPFTGIGHHTSDWDRYQEAHDATPTQSHPQKHQQLQYLNTN